MDKSRWKLWASRHAWQGILGLLVAALAGAFVLGFIVGRASQPSPEEVREQKEQAVRIAIIALEAYA
jgi:hypothetical protein